MFTKEGKDSNERESVLLDDASSGFPSIVSCANRSAYPGQVKNQY
jgi:hypothetical protein